MTYVIYAGMRFKIALLPSSKPSDDSYGWVGRMGTIVRVTETDEETGCPLVSVVWDEPRDDDEIDWDMAGWGEGDVVTFLADDYFFEAV